jgi:hypothetical protein
MQLTLLKGYPDFVGKRATFVGFGSGPASYSPTTGDLITLPMPNFYIDAIAGGTINSVSGLNFAKVQPSGVGPRMKWTLFWFVTSTGAPVGSGVSLATEQLQFGGFCGQY